MKGAVPLCASSSRAEMTWQRQHAMHEPPAYSYVAGLSTGCWQASNKANWLPSSRHARTLRHLRCKSCDPLHCLLMIKTRAQTLRELAQGQHMKFAPSLGSMVLARAAGRCARPQPHCGSARLQLMLCADTRKPQGSQCQHTTRPSPCLCRCKPTVRSPRCRRE